MLKLAFLLIGPRAFQSRWYVVAGLGAALIALALLLAVNASAGITGFTRDVLGLVFIANGVLSLAAGFLGHMKGTARLATILKAAGFVLIGALLIGLSEHADAASAILFGAAFGLDGVWRLTFALVVRYPRWRMMVLVAAVELLLALAIVVQWPVSHDRGVHLSMGLLLALWGWLLVRLGLMLRTLESEVALLALPLFAGRGWYDNAPVLVDPDEMEAVEHPLTVRVWTPVGSAYKAERRLLVDRYIVAIDGNGVISTGHAAIEMQPDLYISHYPDHEVDRSRSDFLAMLRGTSENDFKGRFQPSYEHECGEWCPADASVEFRNYNPRRLRAFWAGYKQDDSYNLTNRNCSVLVASALDAALEGALASRFAWMRFVGLMFNPDMWIAAAICQRADSMTWTPGLVLDYANTMARIVEARETNWTVRFADFVRRARLSDGKAEQPS
ncbi:protease [Mesorhizobium sp. ASY16-5R]|uniref:protease n=1 Tax=Mesorhizobium sp. ASY16-5R TaxID=3445772 RepID=UPI003F9FBFCE